MHEGRKKYARQAVSAALALAIGGVVLATPAQADPVSDAKAKVADLYAQAQAANETYDLVSGQAQDAQAILSALNADLASEQAAAANMRAQVAAIVVAQYQGQSISTASQVALSDDPTSFIRGLGAVSAYNAQRAEILSTYSDQLTRIDMRQKAITQEAASLGALQAQIADAKNKTDKAEQAAQAELNRLDTRTRARVIDAMGPVSDKPTNLPAASGNAAIAVAFALAQVGKPYVHGAAGPNAYDCSGLTMAAWAAAGVGLTHSSQAQKGEGTPISEADLQPGDLVIYYPGATHVGMYVGNGMVVSALNPTQGIKVHPLHMMPVNAYVRVG